MNKRMIVLIALVAVVLAAPASAEETVEVRGTVVELTDAQTHDIAWDATNFAAFWYDLDDGMMTETLTIAATDDWGNPTLDGSVCDRTIDEDCLIYQTCPLYQEYEVYAYEGLAVYGDDGYYLEGWMAEKYVAINGNADKLCELLVEFEDDENKTLGTGEKWDMGGGFSLRPVQNDLEGMKMCFRLEKNDEELDVSGAVPLGEVYTYTEDIGGGSDVPVFSCFVDDMFRRDETNVVVLKYVFLIDNEVLDIETGYEYGAMEVTTASSSQVILRNEYTIDLYPDTTEHIIGDIYFLTADDDNIIRFYPFVEYTIGGEDNTIPASDIDDDGVPDAWDLDNSTPVDYWTDSDGRGRMWGDMNGDGKLTSADALMILQAVVGKIDIG